MQRAMKWFLGLLASAALLCGGFVVLHGSLPPASINAWLPAGSLTAARTGAASVLLQDGRLLITGGNGGAGVLASTDILDPSTGLTAGPPMNLARSNHVAVLLLDGRVLVAGGTDASGRASQSAELFDPAANSWSASGPLMVGRSGATATLLPSGQVLIAGGTANGAALASLELFDPNSNTFSLVAGVLSSARENHAATLLPDGRVLVAGGWDGTTVAPVPPATTGTPNVLASTDIFDPTTGAVGPGPALTSPRMNFTATTALDGSVVAIGGTDGQNDLASIDVLASGAGAFALSGAQLATARQGHQAFLLPHNGNILVVGGASSGAAISSAELYTSWTGATSVTGAMASARSGATGSPLFQMVFGAPVGIDGALIVAGGQDTSSPPAALQSAEVYGFATVTTDKADYQPGDTVNMSGSGWQPNETVQMSLVEVPDLDGDSPIALTATADANGNFSNVTFPINVADLNVHFTLTAVGSVSQAQTRFTDNKNLTTTFAGTGTGSVAVATTTDSTKNHTCTGSPNPCAVAVGNTDVGTLTATANSPAVFAGWTLASGGVTGCSGNTCNFSMGNAAQSVTATFNPGPAAEYVVTSNNFSPVAGTAVTITAQLTDSGGNPVHTAGKVVTWSSTNGGSFGSPTSTTNANGVATVSFTTNTVAGTVHTVTATDTDAHTGTSANITTVGGSVTHFSVEASGGGPIGTQTAGTAFSIRVTALDANNNVATSFSGSSNKVNLTSTGTLVFTNPSAPFSSGVLDPVSVTITNTGNFTITATQSGGGGSPPFGTSNSFLVNAGAPAAAHSTITGTTPVAADGSSTSTITITLEDANSNPVSGVTPTFSATGSNNTYGICSATDTSGKSTCTLKSTTAEVKTLSIVTPVAVTGGTVTFTSASVGTSTTVASSVNPSVFGESVTFTAVVSPSSGTNTPTGTIAFVIDGGGSVAGTPATCPVTAPANSLCVTTSTSTLTVSGVAHTVSANYTHTGSFSDSSGLLSGGQTVSKADTTTTVGTISPEPSLVGESYSVAYTVVAKSPGSGTPTGTVTVDDGNGNNCSATVAAASCSLTSTSTGTKTITATYAGDTSFNGSNGTASHVVSKRPTTTTVTSVSPSSVPLGVGTTVSVTVKDTGSGTASNPAGTVALTSTDTHGSFTTCTLASSGTDSATCTATYTPGGTISGTSRTDTIKASFTVSDTTHQDSSDTTGMTLTVTKRSTSTTVTSLSLTSVVVAQSTDVTVTVTDTESGTPSNPGGTVSLASTGTGAFGTCTLSPSGANAATCTTTYTPSSAAVSPQTITASFTATDSVHKDSADSTGKSLTVNRRSTSTAVSFGTNPVVTGQSSTVTVTVSDTEALGNKQSPAGNVSLTSSEATDVFTSTSCTLVSTGTGVSACSVSVKPVHIATSPHTITASFLETDVHLASSGHNDLTVNKASTQITGIAASPEPSVLGASYSVSWTLGVVAPGSGSPTGTVNVSDGHGNTCTATAPANTCTVPTSTVAGPLTLTVTYLGDSDFNGSSGTGSHTISFNFLGLFDPYAPPTTGRAYKIKSAIPLIWQYADVNGAPVPSSNANPKVIIYGPYACGGTPSTDVITVNDAGSSGYQYDPTTNTWQFNWKTTGLSAGCYNITITSVLTAQTNGPFPIQLR